MNERLSVVPSTKDAFTVRAEIAEFGGQATMHWGDGSTPTHVIPGQTNQHTFPAVGRYMVTAVDNSGVLIGRRQIAVTGSLMLDGIAVTDEELGIRISFFEVDTRLGGVSQYRIEWQDGDVEHAWGIPGYSVRHDAVPGWHDIKVVDTASGRTQRYPVHVTSGPVFDPDFTVHRWSSDESGMTVYIRVRKVRPGYSLHIWWDDADGPQLVQHPTVGMEIPHIYRYPGSYMQTVAYAGSQDTSRTKTDSVSVPGPGRWRLERRSYSAGEIAPSARETASEKRLPGGGDRDHGRHFGLESARARLSRFGLGRAGAVGAEEPSVDGDADPAVGQQHPGENNYEAAWLYDDNHQ